MVKRKYTLTIKFAMLEMMDKLDFDPESVVKKHKMKIVRGHGQFYCTDCDELWTSHYSWALVNLNLVKLHRVWHQKCINCGIEYLPSFDLDEIRRMVEVAVKKYLNALEGKFRVVDARKIKKGVPPHPKELCEKCEYGLSCCYRPPQVRGPDRKSGKISNENKPSKQTNTHQEKKRNKNPAKSVDMKGVEHKLASLKL